MINKLISFIRAKYARGFTLVEMLVAVLLLITAIAGPLTIASRGITAAVVSKDQVTAFNLAQDAMEYIRYKRDTNKLCLAAGSTSGVCSGVTSWLSSFSPACTGANGCYLDSTENDPSTPQACPTGGCPTRMMRYDLANRRYTYTSSPAASYPQTIFTRIIFLTTPVSGQVKEASVTVRVFWSDQANITREVVIRENILDWQ